MFGFGEIGHGRGALSSVLFDSKVSVCHRHKHVYCVVHSVTQDQDKVKDLIPARHDLSHPRWT